MTNPSPKIARESQPGSAKKTYLIFYNGLSALLRAWILFRTVQLWSTRGNGAVWDELNSLALWTETLTAIEIIHAATGVVRAAVATTALQVAGRNTIVWAITRNYPDVAARQWAYSSMLVAWNLADAVRYTLFAMERLSRSAPNVLLWLRYGLQMLVCKRVRKMGDELTVTCRYNIFIVLYPVGMLSEAWLDYNVIVPSRSRNPLYQYLLWFGLAMYIPGIYMIICRCISSY